MLKFIFWSLTLTLVIQACYEYHLTWARVPHIVREFCSVWRVVALYVEIRLEITTPCCTRVCACVLSLVVTILRSIHIFVFAQLQYLELKIIFRGFQALWFWCLTYVHVHWIGEHCCERWNLNIGMIYSELKYKKISGNIQAKYIEQCLNSKVSVTFNINSV